MNIREGKAYEWFDRLIQYTHSFLQGPGNTSQQVRTKKTHVAVLDNGFAARSPHARSFNAQVVKMLDYVADDQPGNVDKDGHGTDVL